MAIAELQRGCRCLCQKSMAVIDPKTRSIIGSVPTDSAQPHLLVLSHHGAVSTKDGHWLSVHFASEFYLCAARHSDFYAWLARLDSERACDCCWQTF